jgi:hypothetical protein
MPLARRSTGSRVVMPLLEGRDTLYEVELTAAPSEAWRVAFLRPPSYLTGTQATPEVGHVSVHGLTVQFRTDPRRLHSWLGRIDEWIAFCVADEALGRRGHDGSRPHGRAAGGDGAQGHEQGQPSHRVSPAETLGDRGGPIRRQSRSDWRSRDGRSRQCLREPDGVVTTQSVLYPRDQHSRCNVTDPTVADGSSASIGVPHIRQTVGAPSEPEVRGCDV